MRAAPRISLSFFFMHVAVPLLVGGLIYLGFRTPQLLVFAWVEALGGLPGLLWLRAAVEPLGRALPSWVVHSLPDGLWVYALTAFMLHLWRAGPARPRRAWAALGAVLGLGWEACQWLALVPGTFDRVDVLLMVALAGLALVLHRQQPPEVERRVTPHRQEALES